MAVRFVRPLQIIEHSESLEIQDAKGRRLAYIYYEDEQSRREQMHRLTGEEAWAFARWVVRTAEEARGREGK